MKFSVDQWRPDFASPLQELDGVANLEAMDYGVELEADAWRAIPVQPCASAGEVAFIDGVQRIDARAWLDDGSRMGLFVSVAAGVVRCDESAKVEASGIGRYLIAPRPEGPVRTALGEYQPWTTKDDLIDTLMNGLGEARSALEVELAGSANAPLVVIDGPLRGREKIPGAVGYIKSHRVQYLPEDLAKVVAGLQPDERSPVFFMDVSWKRYSWYLRLPGGKGHPWAGIVRCEADRSLSSRQAVDVANSTAASLPRFASAPHKDPRAPQNLYPIKGLEDALRARLGDADLLYRSILRAAA